MSRAKDVSSRHAGAPTYRRAGGDGEVMELLAPRAAAVAEPSLLHRVVAGDRLDLLAARYFGDPFQYWRIADANPCDRPEELLEVGRILRIPRGA